MSMEYMAIINGEEYGPVGFADLKDMFSRGEITDETRVRFYDGSGNWFSWGDARSWKDNESQRSARTAPQTKPSQITIPDLPARRVKLRELTGYPALRIGLILLLVVSIIGLVISAFAMMDTDARVLGIAGAVSSIGSIFSVLILAALLDIADALLVKLD